VVAAAARRVTEPVAAQGRGFSGCLDAMIERLQTSEPVQRRRILAPGLA
jgi:hypothetical protein